MRKEDVYKALYDPKYYMELVKYVKDNKELLQSALRNQNVEHFKLSMQKSKEGTDDTDISSGAAMAMVIFIFIMFLFATIIWVWALVALIKYWNLLPTAVQAIGVICLITGFGGPVVTLILVYVFKGKGNSVNPVAKISSFI